MTPQPRGDRPERARARGGRAGLDSPHRRTQGRSGPHVTQSPGADRAGRGPPSLTAQRQVATRTVRGARSAPSPREETCGLRRARRGSREAPALCFAAELACALSKARKYSSSPRDGDAVPETYVSREKMARVSVWSAGVASIPMIGTLRVTRCGSDLRLVRCAAPLFFWGTPTRRGQPCD